MGRKHIEYLLAILAIGLLAYAVLSVVLATNLEVAVQVATIAGPFLLAGTLYFSFKASRAAMNANEVTQRIFGAEMRPWLSIEPAMTSPLRWYGQGALINFKFTVKNYGRSPALAVTSHTSLCIAHQGYGSYEDKILLKALTTYPQRHEDFFVSTPDDGFARMSEEISGRSVSPGDTQEIPFSDAFLDFDQFSSDVQYALLKSVDEKEEDRPIVRLSLKVKLTYRSLYETDVRIQTAYESDIGVTFTNNKKLLGHVRLCTDVHENKLDFFRHRTFFQLLND